MAAGDSSLSEGNRLETAAKTLGADPKDVEEARRRLKEEGVAGFARFMTEKEVHWKKQVLKIGITGISGCGKSTFINTIRGLNASDNEAAETGVNETTLEPRLYSFLGYDMVQLWEVPGINTPRFPKGTYLEKIDFDSYDFFFILSSGRFLDDDAWLGAEAAKRDKKFFYVRTKVDQDIANEQRDHPYKTEEEVLESIESEIRKKLKNCGFQYEPLIFLVGPDFEKYDIGNLKAKIKENCPALKREQLVMVFNAITKQEIKEKADVLGKRIWHRGAISIAANCTRIPGTGMAVDLTLIQSELQYYYDQLGLSDEGLARKADLSGCAMELLRQAREMGYPKALLATTSITRGILAAGAAGASLAAATVLTGGTAALAVGVAGAADLTGLTASYANVHYTLRQSLDKMTRAAMMVADAAVAKSIPMRATP